MEEQQTAQTNFTVEELTTIGRGGDNHIRLDHPRSEKLHAVLEPRGKDICLVNRSSIGVFVNGRLVRGECLITQGGRIGFPGMTIHQVGPDRQFQIDRSPIQMTGLNLSLTVLHGGREHHLLRDVSLEVRGGQTFALAGPSGSGKSVLSKILSGRLQPSEGKVEIDGRDLYSNFATLRDRIALIPQTPLFHEQLLVRRQLEYLSQIVFARDWTADEISPRIEESMRLACIQNLADQRIASLSGGQRIRLAFACALLRQPSIIIADELTSPLDVHNKRLVWDVVERCKLTGVAILLVTHSPAEVERCDTVCLLSRGRQVFYGPAKELPEHFGVKTVDDAYEQLESRTEDELNHGFLNSKVCRDAIAGLATLEVEDDGPMEPLHPWTCVKGCVDSAFESVRQAWLLGHRYLSLQLADIANLTTMALMSLLVAGLLGLVFADVAQKPKQIKPEPERLVVPVLATPMETAQIASSAAKRAAKEAASQFQEQVRVQRLATLLFLLEFTVLFMGLSNSAKELVRERELFRSESALGLTGLGYYLSKVPLLVALTAVQVLLLWLPVCYCLDLPGDRVKTACLLIALSSLGVSMGLALSAWAPTPETAASLIPLVLVPQFILGGAVAPLGWWDGWMAVGTTSWWGHHGMLAVNPDAVPTGTVLWGILLVSLALAIQAFVFVLIALVGIWRLNLRMAMLRRLAGQVRNTWTTAMMLRESN